MNTAQQDSAKLRARIVEQTTRSLRTDLLQEFGGESEIGLLVMEAHENAKLLLNKLRDLAITEPPGTATQVFDRAHRSKARGCGRKEDRS